MACVRCGQPTMTSGEIYDGTETRSFELCEWCSVALHQFLTARIPPLVAVTGYFNEDDVDLGAHVLEFDDVDEDVSFEIQREMRAG